MNRILCGDCIEVLKTLDAGSVQTCVTSPPYYGLRDYGTAKWEGGDPACDHAEKRGGNGDASTKQTTSNGTQNYQYRGTCGKCGAVRVDNQIGLEETPEAFVDKLVQVFREVRRVLADDGTLWLNLGDSYAADTKWGGVSSGKNAYKGIDNGLTGNRRRQNTGLKHKDLIGIPWMVAFALRADGWYLRSDIIWHKPNPMPESVTDRPTKSHEYIFLLSKSPQYYYNHEAILEPVSPASVLRLSQDIENQEGSARANGGAKTNGNMKAVVRGGNTSWRGERTIPGEKRRNMAYSFARKVNESPKPGEPSQHRPDREPIEYTGQRNKRSVWTVTTRPYKEAHFATFPPDLIEPCILAGSKPGDIVLDPFAGSGTTLAVATKHHRDGVGIELNPEYVRLIERRLSRVQPVLLGIQ